MTGRTGRRTVGRSVGCCLTFSLLASGTSGQAPSGPLVVFNAGSLAAPFRDLLQEFRRRNPAVQPRQESSGSLEAARKLTELGRIPDVIGVADSVVIPSMLFPSHATWYATFARNAMTLVYSARSDGAGEITGVNWWRILLRPGIRTGRSDPALDPNGYRTLLVTQLAERHYQQPGLAGRLLAAMPPRYMRPKEADLVALVQAGELDYAWSYRSIAATVGLRSLTLPPQVDLSDPALGNWYAQASVRLPGSTRAAGDSVTVLGAPIVYALTIPTRAANRPAAEAFARFVFSPEGQAVLGRHGFLLMEHPVVGGPGRPPKFLP
ncbi:MAG TPA: extracellular solute-binding protein [Gemmatimonadales bacterium]